MGFIKEFKDFASKGNLVDMAIAFVMGAAFTKVVTAFVQKMFAPVVGLILGGVNLADKKWIIKDAVPESKDAAGNVIAAVPEVAFGWGEFVTACIDFLLVAFVMFLLVKGMNRMKKKQEEAPAPPPEPTQTEILLTEIRDALKK
jgi:large conductance mechanosensitive channel